MTKLFGIMEMQPVPVSSTSWLSPPKKRKHRLRTDLRVQCSSFCDSAAVFFLTKMFPGPGGCYDGQAAAWLYWMCHRGVSWRQRPRRKELRWSRSCHPISTTPLSTFQRRALAQGVASTTHSFPLCCSRCWAAWWQWWEARLHCTGSGSQTGSQNCPASLSGSVHQEEVEVCFCFELGRQIHLVDSWQNVCLVW